MFAYVFSFFRIDRCVFDETNTQCAACFELNFQNMSIFSNKYSLCNKL
jgi:hypothetical protein